MAGASILEVPELALERIDARAGAENFPVVSLLAPSHARPHLRAIYGFARLVDSSATRPKAIVTRCSTSSSASSSSATARAPHGDHAPPARTIAACELPIASRSCV